MGTFTEYKESKKKLDAKHAHPVLNAAPPILFRQSDAAGAPTHVPEPARPEQRQEGRRNEEEVNNYLSITNIII